MTEPCRRWRATSTADCSRLSVLSQKFIEPFGKSRRFKEECSGAESHFILRPLRHVKSCPDTRPEVRFPEMALVVTQCRAEVRIMLRILRRGLRCLLWGEPGRGPKRGLVCFRGPRFFRKLLKSCPD